jgi:ferrous-iron efflux pump FieF
MTLPAGREDSGLRRRAAVLSLSLAIALTFLKLAAALATGSLAVLSSLIDSLGDVVASGITLTSVRIAQRPPDRHHRFGHGKAESLSALAQAAIVAGSAGYVLLDGVQRLAAPRPIESGFIGITVMLIAIAGTMGLVLYQRRVVRLTGSPAIAADSLHYSADLFTNLAVIASLILVERLGWSWVDPIVAAAIAAYLLWHAIAIARQAIDVLMDLELPGEDRDRIRSLVLAHPEVQDMHDLRTRLAGGTRFIELHIEIPGEMTISVAHTVTDALEDELRQAFPDAEIIIHQEPAGLDDPRLDDRIRAATAGSE